MRPRGVRGRLLAGIVALLAAGLLLGDAVAYLALREFLAGRADRTLELTTARALSTVRGISERPLEAEVLTGEVPAVVYVAVYDVDGALLVLREPDGLAGLDVGVPAALPAAPVTVADGRGGPGVRVRRGLPEPGEDLAVVVDGERRSVGGIVIGVSLAEHAQILRRLLLVQVVSYVLLIGAAVVAARVVLRVGLRPLDELAATARAVGSGDLDRRVPSPDPRTEVGAVGLALNDAFDRRRASEQQVRRFMADASHELRTPLAAVHGWSDLYLHGGVQDWDQADLAMRRIREEAVRMTATVEELLTLARLDAHQPLVREPVDLAGVCGEVVAALSLTAPGHRVTLDAVDDPQPLADPAAVRQVVANLVGNAVRHTPPGTEVRLQTRAGDDDVVLMVRDDGPGLDAAQRAMAAERFWRADRAHGGSGLGLAIVHDLVLAQGGRLDLDEAPGGGLQVTVGWPRARPG